VTTHLSPEQQRQRALSMQVLGILRWLLIAVCVVVAWLALRYLAGVLAPILVAFGIAYLLNPVLNRMTHHGISRSVGAAVLLVTIVVGIVGLVFVLAPKVSSQVNQFITDLPAMMKQLDVWLQRHFDAHIPDELAQYANSGKLGTILSDSEPLREIAAAAATGLFHFLGEAAEFLLVPVFSFYFLHDWPNILQRVDHVIPPRRRAVFRELFREIDQVVAGWVRGQAIVTAILAALYAIGFTLVGMPLSLPVGLVVGLLTVIPFVGTFVGATIALAIVIATGGSLGLVLAVGGVILVNHLLEAGVLTPKIVGHRVGLSESAALFAVVAGGKLLGFVGVVLAVPIAATVAVLVRYAIRYYEHTSFFGHESDADVVITPAMALIMPGVVPGAKIVTVEHEAEIDPEMAEPEAVTAHEDWQFDTELGAAGAPKNRSHEP